MPDQCCKEILQRYADRLRKQGITLVKASGNQQSTFEQAIFRRAEIIGDVLKDLKEFAKEQAK